MDEKYKPREENSKEDPPVDTNDESTHLQSVEEFHVAPALSSVASSSAYTSADAPLEMGKTTPPNVLEDLLRDAKEKEEVTGQGSPPTSPTRSKKKRSAKQKRKGSKGSKVKNKDKVGLDVPVTPAKKPKSRPAERDVLLTSVHMKQEDVDASAGTEMSEITTPLALRPKKNMKSDILWETTGHDKIDEVPISPTEEDLTESTSNVNQTDEKEDASQEPQRKIRDIPSLTSEDSQHNILAEQVVFAVALPEGPSGLILKDSYNHSVISGVSEKSPLSGIVEPGLIVVGLHLPGDGAEQPSATLTNLVPKKLSRILRQSSHQHLRLLWLTKEASEDFSTSWVTSMSTLWLSNAQARTFAATPKKTLISLPPGDLGISLLGKPPLIDRISSVSPLQGLPMPADVGDGKLYVTSLYCAETGDHWDGMDAHQLSETLRSTSQQRMRILVVTSENVDDDHSEESLSPSFHSSTESNDQFPSQSVAEEATLKKHKSPESPRQKTAASIGLSPNRLVTEDDTLKKDKSPGSPRRKYATSKKDKSPESPRRKSSEKHLKIHSSKGSLGDSILKISPTPRHIIVKKSSNSSGRFSFSKVHAFSFHGLSMDKDLAKTVQSHLDRIDSGSAHRLTLVQDGGGQASPRCFVATMNAAFQKRHEEDALVAIMDAMASTGWVLQCPIDQQGDRRSSETLFIFTK